MSNGIRIRENEEQSIEMLAAQRQLYNDAKKYGWLSSALSVWFPFILAILLLFIPEDSPVGIASYVLAIISAIVSFIVDKEIRDKKEMAALIQQKFDVYVYDMPWNKRLFGTDRNVSNEIVSHSYKILLNEEEKKALYDWYTPLVDDKELHKGILDCQRENVFWDVGLRKKYKRGSILIIVFLCSCVFVMGIWKNESAIHLLWRLAFIMPMLEWLLSTISQINTDIKKLKEVDELINDNEVKTMDDLQDIQKCIYEHRKSCFSIPNFFYKLFKDNDEDKAHKIASRN